MAGKTRARPRTTARRQAGPAEGRDQAFRFKPEREAFFRETVEAVAGLMD